MADFFGALLISSCVYIAIILVIREKYRRDIREFKEEVLDEIRRQQESKETLEESLSKIIEKTQKKYFRL